PLRVDEILPGVLVNESDHRWECEPEPGFNGIEAVVRVLRQWVNVPALPTEIFAERSREFFSDHGRNSSLMVERPGRAAAGAGVTEYSAAPVCPCRLLQRPCSVRTLEPPPSPMLLDLGIYEGPGIGEILKDIPCFFDWLFTVYAKQQGANTFCTIRPNY